jgi:hypothetical protein
MYDLSPTVIIPSHFTTTVYKMDFIFQKIS